MGKAHGTARILEQLHQTLFVRWCPSTTRALHECEQPGDDWKALAEHYEELRAEIRAGRGDEGVEQPAEVQVFRANLFDLIGDGVTLSNEDAVLLDALATRIVEIVQEAISIVDFWRKPDQVRRLRADIDTEVMVSGIAPMQDNHQRISVELTKLAEKRHAELLRS